MKFSKISQLSKKWNFQKFHNGQKNFKLSKNGNLQNETNNDLKFQKFQFFAFVTATNLILKIGVDISG